MRIALVTATGELGSGYLQRTLESLLDSLPKDSAPSIGLFADGEGYEPAPLHDRLTVVDTSQDAPHVLRALRWLAGASAAEATVLLEDDLEFAKDWILVVEQALQRLVGAYVDPNITRVRKPWESPRRFVPQGSEPLLLLGNLEEDRSYLNALTGSGGRVLYAMRNKYPEVAHGYAMPGSAASALALAWSEKLVAQPGRKRIMSRELAEICKETGVVTPYLALPCLVRNLDEEPKSDPGQKLVTHLYAP